ncbi:hypothetical protein BU15DRAFT_87338 [Melanogaster broomeanus]|nr:hypothetical protein BU15DRAFT_87338 [Melanogaster broomeanus]
MQPCQVINPRSALLSNFEVLTILRELDVDHIARTKTAIRIKKEEDNAGKPIHDTHTEEVSENLRTVELEAIQYLSADYQPTRRQSDPGISQLARGLRAKLQVVNLAPTEPVELYVVCIFQMIDFNIPSSPSSDRLSKNLKTVLAIVWMKFLTWFRGLYHVPLAQSHAGVVEVYNEVEQEVWEQDTEDIVFDDTGEGIGVEGDLDMEED